jgi:hypothetical protein
VKTNKFFPNNLEKFDSTDVISDLLHLQWEKKSVENQICKCTDIPTCNCIQSFLNDHFDAKGTLKPNHANKNDYKNIENKLKEFLQKNKNLFPTDLEIFDLTDIKCIGRNLLKLNPVYGQWPNYDDLKAMTDESKGGALTDDSIGCCLNFIRNIRNNFYGHLNC